MVFRVVCARGEFADRKVGELVTFPASVETALMVRLVRAMNAGDIAVVRDAEALEYAVTRRH